MARPCSCSTHFFTPLQRLLLAAAAAAAASALHASTAPFTLSPSLPPSLTDITYTGIPGRLAVDFVSTVAGSAAAHTSIDGGRTWLLSPATSLEFPTIGYLGQAALEFTGVAPGAKAQYFITAAGSNSSVYEVTPIVARPERFAVFGDFGLAEDVCMDDLIAQAGTGAFDSVLHVSVNSAHLFSLQQRLKLSPLSSLTTLLSLPTLLPPLPSSLS